MSDFRYEAFSVEHPSNSIFTILTSVIGGFFIAFTFVAHYIEYKKVMDIGDTGDTDDTDDTADLSEDEDIAIGVFTSLPSKTQVAQVAQAFYNYYKKDILYPYNI